MRNTKRRRYRGPAAAPLGGPEPAAARRDPGTARDRRTWLVVIPLVLLVAAAFLPILRNGFVNWDDDLNFVRNPDYRGLGWAQVKWACTTFRAGVYQPLAWLLLEAQYALCGPDPRGYHLASLLLHAADAVALYALTRALLVRCRPEVFGGRPWARAIGAGLATALFAVHPLRVEAVAWVSCQPYLPCALFAILAVLAYLRAVGDEHHPRAGWLAGSFVLLAAALLSHPPAVGLPAVLLILDVYPLRRLGGGPGRWLGPAARRVWLEKVPFVAMSAVFMGLAIAAKAETRTIAPLEGGDLTGRIAQACYGTWFYLVKSVIPRDITAFYPFPGRIDWWAPRFLLSILATLAVSVGLFLLRRRWPGVLAAWLCYLVLLAPNSGLVRIGSQVAADRYSYLSMLGLVVAAAAGLGLVAASSRPARAAVVLAAGAAVLGLAMMTWGQCRVWRDSEALWSHVVEHGGGSNGIVHVGLGAVCFDQARFDEAAAHYGEAVRLDPGLGRAHCGLGVVLDVQGRFEEAIAQFEEAIRLDPGLAQAHSGLATARLRQGRFEEAIAQFEEAIRLDPDLAHAHYGLGSALSSRGRYREAIAHYDEAVRLKPDFIEAYNDRAMMLASCPEPRYRDGKGAVASAARACELTGWKQPSCLDTLAAAYAEAGDFTAAAARQEEAIGLLTDGAKKDDYRTRLALYRAGEPFRAPPPATGPAGGTYRSVGP